MADFAEYICSLRCILLQKPVRRGGGAEEETFLAKMAGRHWKRPGGSSSSFILLLMVLLLMLQVRASTNTSEAVHEDEEDETEGMTEYEKVVSKTRILIANPAQGSNSTSSPRVFVNVHTPDVERFSEHFNNSYVCVQLDKQPYACWPIAFAVIKLANLQQGPHTVGTLHTLTSAPSLEPFFVLHLPYTMHY